MTIGILMLCLPIGYYCPEGAGAVTPTTCSYGEYCPEKSTAPTPCPTGYYCANEALEWPTGRCRGGYVCKLRAATHSPETATSGTACTENSQGYPCPAGYYCQSGRGLWFWRLAFSMQSCSSPSKLSRCTPLQARAVPASY